MFNVIVGNAPVSWGVYTASPESGTNPDWHTVMDDIARAGYAGTELGPYGFYPTDATFLRAELARTNLLLGSSFVPAPLEHPDQVDAAIDHALLVSSLLSQFGVEVILLADDLRPERGAVAGFVAGDGSDGWNDSEWRHAADTVNLIARAVHDRYGMQVAFHHHAGTYVETPDEIDRLMAMTNPELVGLCLDTGHYVYGGGDPVEAARRYANRIWYVHLKDVWPDRMNQVRRTRAPMDRAWAMGVFSELGQGCVDFPRIVEVLCSTCYQGWLVVEQDVVKDPEGRAPWSPFESAVRSRAYLREAVGL